MSRTELPCTSANPPGTSEHRQGKPLTVQEQREALIVPLTARLRPFGQRRRSDSLLTKLICCNS
jgi:hypothetical protein